MVRRQVLFVFRGRGCIRGPAITPGRVQGSGFGAWRLGFRVRGQGSGVRGQSGCMAEGVVSWARARCCCAQSRTRLRRSRLRLMRRACHQARANPNCRETYSAKARVGQHAARRCWGLQQRLYSQSDFAELQVHSHECPAGDYNQAITSKADIGVCNKPVEFTLVPLLSSPRAAPAVLALAEINRQLGNETHQPWLNLPQPKSGLANDAQRSFSNV